MLSLAEFQLLASFQCLFIVLKKEKKRRRIEGGEKIVFQSRKAVKRTI